MPGIYYLGVGRQKELKEFSTQMIITAGITLIFLGLRIQKERS